MDYKPFVCPNCLNWYTPVPMPDDMMCAICAVGKHAPNIKTGVIDCHWGHMTATPSEVKMATLLQLVNDTSGKIEKALRGIGGAKNLNAVREFLEQAERDVALMDKSLVNVPEIQRWAAVKEMPGLRDAEGTQRFKHLDALEELVKGHRRPKEDIIEVKRSVKTCRQLADELPEVVSNVRLNLGQVRRDAESWSPPAVEEQTPPRNNKPKRRQALGVA